jgi:hypothetical protein
VHPGKGQKGPLQAYRTSSITSYLLVGGTEGVEVEENERPFFSFFIRILELTPYRKFLLLLLVLLKYSLYSPLVL